MATLPVREQLLEQAQNLIRQRGYNGFSYADLAKLVNVKTSSIHYYFPCKDDLLIAVIDRYTEQAATQMNNIDATLSAYERLKRYAALFDGLPADQVCLCGMLAANFASLSDRARHAVQSFFRTHESWLNKVVAEGERDGSLHWPGEPDAAGRYLFAALQGSLMGARLFQTPARMQDVLASIKATLRPAQKNSQ